MTNYRTLGAFAADLESLAKSLGGAGAAQVAKVMGVEAQKLAERAAKNDLGGDAKFSGWAPVLDTKLRPLEAGVILLTPTRQSAGPWTVAQLGRNQGNASGFSGPGVNRTTGATLRTKSGGLRKVRAAKGRRWNGTTRGKGTADDAVALFDREMPKIVEREMNKLVAKYFD